MMSQEKNDEITLTSADQPAGKVLRQFWLPAALSDELMGKRPVVAVKLAHENLVLFRDESGQLGLIARNCPHRGADMCYGRLEQNGLRCPFHGWHFDVSGQCIEQPAEPENSRMHENIKTTSYPVVEKNGIIWAYMGKGEAPPLPDLDCFNAPQSHVFAFKGKWECNWLQALEVGIDPAHASFLHRFLQDEDPKDSYGKQFRDTAAGTDIPMTQVLREFPRPKIEATDTEFGMRLISTRDLNNGNTHVRVTNQIFPCAIEIPMSNEMNITQWHVPIDDHSCYWYSMFTSYGEPVDKVKMREQRLKEHRLPDYAPLKNAANNYGYDPDEQDDLTYTGMGLDINVHDQWAVEAMGSIQDRTREHLASSDVGIIRYRRKLRKIISQVCDEKFSGSIANDELQADVKQPIAIDLISPDAEIDHCWERAYQKRRSDAPWGKSA